MPVPVLIDEGAVAAMFRDAPAVPLHPGIDAALALLDAVPDTAGLALDLLRQIELNLAAHFVAVADPRVIEESYAGARFKYETGHMGDQTGLRATRYGRAAIALDITGALADLGQRTASMEFEGWH